MLVEGNQTEMRVYPRWFEILLPQHKRVDTIAEAAENSYILKCGFGIPNIYNYIKSTAEDLCLNENINYFIICIDLEGEVEEKINKKIDQILEPYKEKMSAEKIVVIQKQCIETWFLGNSMMYPKERSNHFEPFHNFYNVSIDDPEEMIKPHNFEGSVAKYHLRYLASMFRSNRMNYGKSSTKWIEKEWYIEQLIERSETTEDLKSFKLFLEICNMMKHS